MSNCSYVKCHICDETKRCTEIIFTQIMLCETCIEKLKRHFETDKPKINSPGLTVKPPSNELTFKYPFSDRTAKPKPYESPAKRKARAAYREHGEEIPGDSKYLEDETWTFKDGYLKQDNE